MGIAQSLGDGYDVRSLAVTYRDGHTLGFHAHPWAQLVYARSGLMLVNAGGYVCFVPPTKAVWVPAQTKHQIAFRGEVALRTLYIAPQRAAAVAAQVNTLEISPLLRELIVHVLSLGMLDPNVAQHRHLMHVLVDLVASAPSLDLVLPRPKDARAARLAAHLCEAPADRRPAEALAAEFGASLRTMQRYFASQTGLSLDAWRQKARLVHGFTTLTSGASVAQAAGAAGYVSTSAFIAAFKRQFDLTPGQVARSASAP